MDWPALSRIAEAIGPHGGSRVLGILEAAEEERAAAIGQLHLRDDGALLEELLLELEKKEWARQSASRWLGHVPALRHLPRRPVQRHVLVRQRLAGAGEAGGLRWGRPTRDPPASLESMINGTHVIVYSRDAEADRAFIRDVLGFPGVDAGEGWLILKLPPAEIALHPTDGDAKHELYLMCDDIEGVLAGLAGKGVEISRPVSDEGWGLLASIRLPGGSDLPLYEPRHPVAYDLDG